jgi:hypothetical protein
MNGGGAYGGGDMPECAIDGLWHEMKYANWDSDDLDLQRIVFHIYDCPPHGDFAGGNPDEHDEDS